MGKADYLALGQWNVICDVCGFKFKSGQIQKRWDGLYVCPKDYEPRHPQDFLRGIPDDQSVAFTRPEATDTFLADNEVTVDDL